MTLVEQFEVLDADGIRRFVETKQEENLQLEFKTISDADFKQRDDRKNLAKSIAGFANSSGGTIIWGVKARKIDGIDAAHAINPIEPVQQLVARLNELTGQATSPIVDGIRHKAIPLEGTSGCAATLVPESLAPPHMAKLGEDRYYKRSGSSFYVMEHFDVQDMFGRRSKPDLELSMYYDLPSNGMEGYEVKFTVINKGRSSAFHFAYLAEFQPTVRITHIGSMYDVSSENLPDRTTVTFTSKDVIHPVPIAMRVGTLCVARTDPTQMVSLKVTYYCDQMPAKTKVWVLTFQPPGTKSPSTHQNP